MKITTEKQWQARRNWFNHDWLKNKFQLSLDRFVRVIDEEDEDPDFACRFLKTGLAVWEQQFPTAIDLIDTFESRMSARVLFDRLPLSRWPKEKVWLPTLVHALWQARLQTACLVVEARERAQQANLSYQRLTAYLKENSDTLAAGDLRCCRSLFIQFRDSCRALSKAFEQFPNRVSVT